MQRQMHQIIYSSILNTLLPAFVVKRNILTNTNETLRTEKRNKNQTSNRMNIVYKSPSIL